MTTPANRNLDTVKKIRDPKDRLLAVIDYLTNLEARRTEAMAVRNDAIRAIDAGHTEVARLSGLSVSTVKIARMTR